MSAAILAQSEPVPNGKSKSRKIPDHLVREVIGGIPFYYPGFRAVLNKTKTLDGVMADSSLQWTLKEGIGDRIKARLDRNRYRFGRGEVSVHLGPNENMGLDMAIFDRMQLPKDKIGATYLAVAPIVAIEIDIQVETLEKDSNIFESYVLLKIQKLLDFGVQRVLWIFTRSQRVFVAEPGKNWYFIPWDEEIEFFQDIRINIQQIIEDEG
jgi:hypothetical protein